MSSSRQTLLFLLLATGFGSKRQQHSVSACGCDVRFYQGSGFGNKPCSRPGVDFGCYPDEDLMWITPPCGSIFRCNADRHDVGPEPAQQRGAPIRCGSRYFHPAPGQTRLNCSCAPAQNRGTVMATKHFFEREAAPRRACGEHATVDASGGVSDAFRRLPQPPGANPAVKCAHDEQLEPGHIRHSFRASPAPRPPHLLRRLSLGPMHPRRLPEQGHRPRKHRLERDDQLQGQKLCSVATGLRSAVQCRAFGPL